MRLGHEVIAFPQVRSAALRIEQERRSNESASDSVQIGLSDIPFELKTDETMCGNGGCGSTIEFREE